MEEGEDSNVEFVDDYLKAMTISEDPLKNAAARDVPNKMEGKSRSRFWEQKRVSQYKELLFGKTLTSTDCNDFLAISTENALAHFPSLQTRDLGDFSKIETLDILHLKYLGNTWRMSFVYSFDRQSYGISKGWNEFVTKYNLKAGDLVYYYKSTHPALDKLYYIDWDEEKEPSETSETESTATSAEIKTIRMYGYELNYLFEKALTPMDIPVYGHWPNLLEIPTQEGEKHFSPLPLAIYSDGEYIYYTYKKNLKVYDASQVMWGMQIERIVDTYYIYGSWEAFVAIHELHAKDVIRFFKVVNNVSTNGCYLIDYVKAKEGGKNPL